MNGAAVELASLLFIKPAPLASLRREYVWGTEISAFLRALIAELTQSGSYYIVVTEQGCLDQRIYLTCSFLRVSRRLIGLKP